MIDPTISTRTRSLIVRSAFFLAARRCTGGHLVTQVYGSACSVGYSRNDPRLWQEFASLVLDASYEATLLAAARNAAAHPDAPGAKKVYLTLLGGGVFGNDISWIARSIYHACAKLHDVDLDVIINRCARRAVVMVPCSHYM
jgi:hypothetical protein